ncbi:hypothetical protein INT45_011186 [Circinella minor]|uniref:Uncharacterized protein n=1 Tax=Circinella minor TaxID=1195481 RepID=A0A8H7RQZ9_9FUNG|nr:hypothetical protein INT45_011186 [Circinella minor]
MGVTKHQPPALASSGGKTGSSAQKKVPLSIEFIKVVQQNFMSGKPFIVCPHCKDIGTVFLSVDTNPKYDPPGPIFHCKECRKQYAHMGILEALIVAAAEASAIDAEMETEHEEPHLTTMTSNNNNNNHHHTPHTPTPTAPNTNHSSWGDQMEQLSAINLEEYNTQQYDYLHPKTPDFVHDIYKHIEKNNKMVAQLAATIAKNTKLLKENMTLTMELQKAYSQIDTTDQPTGSIASKYAPLPKATITLKDSPIKSYAAVTAKGKSPRPLPKKSAIAAAARHLTETPTN